MLNEWISRLRAVAQRDRIAEDIREELELHVRMRTEANIRSGMRPDEAEREARRRFGNLTRLREESFDERGGGLLDALWQDIRFGARLLGRSKTLTATAIATLALGIGANAAIFVVVDQVLLRPLPYPEPGRIVQVTWARDAGSMSTVTGLEYSFLRDNVGSFEAVAALGSSGSGFNLDGGPESLHVRGIPVSRSLFDVLGVNPALGRAFTDEEDAPGGALAAIISDGLWRRYFGGDPDIVGRAIRLNGQDCRVVGVLPASVGPDLPFDVIAPLQLEVSSTNQGRNITMLARLTPGVGQDMAQADVDSVLEAFRAAHPQAVWPGDLGVRLVSYESLAVGDVGTTLLLLLGASGLVLLLACANVAGLLLARGSARTGEMAVRMALGAGPWRLVRQGLTESLLLAAAGTGVALLLAVWTLPALIALSPVPILRLGEIGVERNVVLFAVCAAALASILCGLAPALQFARIRLVTLLNASAGRAASGSAGSRLRTVLVVCQVAVAFVLLASAGLLVRSFVKLTTVDLGFEPRGLTAVQVSLNSAHYATAAQSWSFERQVLERIRSIPGVESAAVVPSLPLERGLNNAVTLPEVPNSRWFPTECRPVSADYFRTLRIPIRRGRGFDETDMATSEPVVVVNETLARLLWKGEDPIGRLVKHGKFERRVVGVAGDVLEAGIAADPLPILYMPMAQVHDSLAAAMNQGLRTSFVVRASGDAPLEEALAQAVRETDSGIPVAGVRSMEDVVSGSIARQRFLAALFSLFGTLALALTSVGLYGLLAFKVGQRTKELAIRLALGATPREVFGLVVGEGLALTALGIAIGIPAAIGVGRFLGAFLYETDATDPFTFALIGALLALIAAAACLVPARRATRVDPALALKCE